MTHCHSLRFLFRHHSSFRINAHFTGVLSFIQLTTICSQEVDEKFDEKIATSRWSNGGIPSPVL